MDEIVIVVYGRPAPQGSKTKSRYGAILDDNAKTLHPWRDAVHSAAVRQRPDGPPLDCPVRVVLTFTLSKPGSAPKRRRTWPTGERSGDLDKLQRSCFDALTDAGVWRSDARVVEVFARKDYPGRGRDQLDRPGVVIRVSPVQDGPFHQCAAPVETLQLAGSWL